MPITYIDAATDNAANGADLSIDVSGLGVAQNDVIYVFASIGHATTDNPSFAVSGDNSGAYTELIEETGTAAVTEQTYVIARQVQGATPDNTITVTVTSGTSENAVSGVARIYRGVDTTTPEDATLPSSVSGNNSQPDGPSITTVTDGAFVISFATARSAGSDTPSAPSGYSNVAGINSQDSNTNAYAITAHISKGGAGAEDPGAWSGFTEATFRPWVTNTVAIRPSTAGGSGDTTHAAARRRTIGY